MKRGTTPVLKIKIGDIPNSNISTIEFLFKQVESESAPALVEKDYPGADVDYNATSNRYHVSLTEAESRLFLECRNFFMDTRVTLSNGKIVPTKIAKLFADKTLFPGGDDDVD